MIDRPVCVCDQSFIDKNSEVGTLGPLFTWISKITDWLIITLIVFWVLSLCGLIHQYKVFPAKCIQDTMLNVGFYMSVALFLISLHNLQLSRCLAFIIGRICMTIVDREATVSPLNIYLISPRIPFHWRCRGRQMTWKEMKVLHTWTLTFPQASISSSFCVCVCMHVRVIHGTVWCIISSRIISPCYSFTFHCFFFFYRILLPSPRLLSFSLSLSVSPLPSLFLEYSFLSVSPPAPPSICSSPCQSPSISFFLSPSLFFLLSHVTRSHPRLHETIFQHFPILVNLTWSMREWKDTEGKAQGCMDETQRRTQLQIQEKRQTGMCRNKDEEWHTKKEERRASCFGGAIISDGYDADLVFVVGVCVFWLWCDLTYWLLDCQGTLCISAAPVYACVFKPTGHTCSFGCKNIWFV